MTTNILKISKLTKSHLRFTLSIMTPAKRAKNNPGAVENAIIFPSENSEPVFSNTIQLIAIRWKPNPIREIIFPKKKNMNISHNLLDKKYVFQILKLIK